MAENTPLPEDIFESTEATSSSPPAHGGAPPVAGAGDTPSVTAPTTMTASPPSTGESSPPPQLPSELFESGGLSRGKKAILAFVGLIIIGLLGVGGVILFRQIQSGGVNTPPTAPPSVAPPLEAITPPSVIIPPPEITPPPVTTPPAAIDTDLDGLTDDEETALGTDPRNADTDGDGLFDREEVRTWKTDPKNPDTDGDSYLDGAEVENGYSPIGPGRLKDFETSRQQLDATPAPSTP